MRAQAPTVGEIRTAKRQAVGGMRKRCRKGKNCSAACIQAGMACLVTMPEAAGVATTKVRDMLEQRQFPNRLMNSSRAPESLSPAPPQSKTEAQKMGAEAKQARKKEAEEKARKKFTAGMEEKWTGKKSTGPEPPSTQPLRNAGTVSPEGKGDWKGQFSGRAEKLDTALDKLQATISKLPPEQQAYWNQQVSEKMGLKGGVPTHRDGSPYTKAEIDKALTSQANGWTSLVKDGAPKFLQDRENMRFAAPKNMIPDTTFTGQRKWISPEDGLVYSAPKKAADKKEGVWGQNRASSKDTDRRLPNISDFRKSQRETGGEWPTQKLPPREGMPKTVSEVLKGLSKTEKDAIVFNGLDASGNEGVRIRAWYNSNPAEKQARLEEVVQRWIDQGGRSGVSGLPVAIPGLSPKPGEARSSVDHFQPISTNRAAALPPQEVRKIADNYKNFLVAEEGPNSNRGAKPWDDWLDKKEKGLGK